MLLSITALSSITTVGLDLAKHVFQVHAIDAFGRVKKNVHGASKFLRQV
jgi:hypothetical protein